MRQRSDRQPPARHFRYMSKEGPFSDSGTFLGTGALGSGLGSACFSGSGPGSTPSICARSRMPKHPNLARRAFIRCSSVNSGEIRKRSCGSARSLVAVASVPRSSRNAPNWASSRAGWWRPALRLQPARMRTGSGSRHSPRNAITSMSARGGSFKPSESLNGGLRRCLRRPSPLHEMSGISPKQAAAKRSRANPSFSAAAARRL